MFRKLGQRAWTFSSHFSGLGSLEVALGMLRAAYPPVDRACLRATTLYACETAPSLRRLLGERTSGCIFKDVLGRTKVDLKDCETFQAKVARLHSAQVSPTASCWMHGASCRVPVADVDVSGSPCQPWSSATQGVRGERHRFAHLIVAWSALMRSDRPALAIHENVVGLRIEMLRRLLGDLYDVQQLGVEPAHAGFGFARRTRRYFVLALRGRVATPSLANTYAALADRLRSPPGAWPEWLWGAGPEELLEVENQGRAFRRLDALEAGGSADWTYLLTPKQRGYIDGFCREIMLKHGIDASRNERCVVDLGQRPPFFSRTPSGRNAHHPAHAHCAVVAVSPSVDDGPGESRSHGFSGYRRAGSCSARPGGRSDADSCARDRERHARGESRRRHSGRHGIRRVVLTPQQRGGYARRRSRPFARARPGRSVHADAASIYRQREGTKVGWAGGRAGGRRCATGAPAIARAGR